MTIRASFRAASVAVALLIVTAIVASPVRAQCDTAPPDMTAFGFTPSAINTTSASQTVTCNMTLTDDVSGVTSATCTFTAPDFFHSASCTASAPSSGTPLSGVWSCVVTFPRYEIAGVWTAGVTATDAVGNNASLDPNFLGFPSTLTITSDPDLIAPALTAFSLVPGSVNVSASSQTVTCNMTLTDAKSGVASAFCALQAPTSSQVFGCASSAPASGTRNNGVFSCVMTVPRYSEAGSWAPAVFPTDVVGNFPFSPITPATSLTVTAVPDDITPPSLSSFVFAPTSINTGSAARTVQCTMVVADSPAGVNTATCTFSFQGLVGTDFVQQSQSCTATAPTTGTRNSGTFQCNVVFPRYSAGAMWASDVSLDDMTGNSADYPQAAQLAVDCSVSEVETTCRFASQTSLTWNAVGGASQYNVYRGPLTNLVDANADHLPDGGYGTCQNSRDAVLTDTVFVDTDVPTAGQKGFFYLVDYKSGGVEHGLGANSFGTPRTVAAPCP